MEFEDWVTKFMAVEREPMSKEISEIFLMTTMGEMADKPLPDEAKNEFMYKVISGRSASIGLSLTDWAKAFLMYLTQSPGSAVMYMYALRSKGKDFNMSKLANMFPAGFLTEESMELMWNDQKVEGGNLLDQVDPASFS